MKVVGLSPGRGELWVTIEDGDGQRVDRPLRDVPTELLAQLVADLPAMVSASIVESLPRTLGGFVDLARRWGVVGEAEGEAEQLEQNRTPGAGGIISEIKAAGRSRLSQWIVELGRIALRAGRARDDYLRHHNDPRPLPEYTRVELATWAGEAERRRQHALTVRDWLSEMGQLVDYDDHDRTPNRGPAGALGVLPLAAPAQIVAILGGLGLAAWIAYLVARNEQDVRRLDAFRETRDMFAQCKTDRECQALHASLVEAGKLAATDDDGSAVPWLVGGSIALFLLVQAVRRRAEAAR